MAQAIRILERRATRNLDRLTDDGLLMVASDGKPEPCAHICFPSPMASPSRRRVRDAARNIDHARRLAKPAIVATIGQVRIWLYLAVEPWRTQQKAALPKPTGEEEKEHQLPQP
ncbi:MULTISPECIES: hypothetical protein [unclassified Streptomyces]|uniref:hypothetical protein n=1 Tax=unclassified Streptomyces TaxID=2593676 RepID=UPI00165185C2|nr:MULTISPECIES: hypothetical protein [unclassified Streptomyces]MDQ0790247.1 hypothetical protein [Streptomyces sp. B3I8]